MSAPESPTPTRKRFLNGNGPIYGAGFLSIVAILVVALAANAKNDSMSSDVHSVEHMVGEKVTAPGGPNDLDALTYPDPATPYAPGTLKKFTLVAEDTEIEVAEGVKYPAWTFNGSAPGPILRVTEGDRVQITMKNRSSHPHTIHTHGIHPADQDGVFETIAPGGEFVYEYTAKPGALQVYHCHAMPLKKHIAKGLYGTFIIDPIKPRPKAKEIVMVMNGFDTDGDGENNFYTVNGKAFYYAKYPIKVKQNELVRIYVSNMTEFDAINSFHMHGNFFTYDATGTGTQKHFTDMVTLAQGERGIIEMRFPNPGKFMFHAHQSGFADLGWMGFFDVQPADENGDDSAGGADTAPTTARATE